jgi:ribosome-associated heat shock protein Hsp15
LHPVTWLWPARFFKTRSLAAKAVDGGKVNVHGHRGMPVRDVKAGDELAMHIGELEGVGRVLEISNRRGLTEAARQLYAETDASLEQRLQVIEARRMRVGPVSQKRGRPSATGV